MTDGSRNFTQRDGENLNVTLRDYVDSRLAAIEKATAVAYESMNGRLATMNEFRQSMQDMRGETVTRVEFNQLRERLTALATCDQIDNVQQRIEEMRRVREAQIKSLEDQIQSLSEYRAELRGKASTSSVLIGYAFTALGVLLAIISLVRELVR